MNNNRTDEQPEVRLLRNDAPRVRITAGAGTASQKSWYLRRPVTLIGSHPEAYVTLSGNDVAAAHCVIVNTGTVVLCKDLHTATGTTVNDQAVDLTVLQDGDLIRVGSTLIQVAVHAFRKSKPPPADGTGDPLKLCQPMWFKSPGASGGRPVEAACAVIGSVEGAAVRLDHPGVSPVHALVFHADGQPAVFALSADAPTLVNGRSVGLAPIEPGDRLRLGEAVLAYVPDECTLVEEITPHVEPEPQSEPPGPSASRDLSPGSASDPGLGELGKKLAVLREDISLSWQRLNDWQGEVAGAAEALERQPCRLESQWGESERHDAALRGRLHDLTAFQEELSTRQAELRAERETLDADRAGLARRARELDRREELLDRRARQPDAVQV